MNLSKKNVLNHGKEGKAPVRKRVNYSRMGYYIFLILVALYFLRLFIYNSYEIKATGMITIPSYEMKVKKDSVLSKITKKSLHDRIKKGELLFVGTVSDVNSGSVTYIRPDLSISRSIISHKKDILTIKSKISNLSRQNSNNKLYNSLELYNSPVKNLDLEIQSLRIELSFLLKSLKDLENLQRLDMKSKKSKIGSHSQRVFNYYAPRDGYLLDVFHKDQDFSLKGETVVAVAEDEKAYILGYFEPSKIKYLNVGTLVDVILPSGETVEGTVFEMESAQSGKKEKLETSYIPTSTSLKTKISLKEADVKKLKNFNKISVKLGVYKWHF